MELTEDQMQQQDDCTDDFCDCHEAETQVMWKVLMERQGWADHGVDFDDINPVHEGDPDYDRGVEEAHVNS